MSIAYRLAVALVMLVASLAFVIITWDGIECAPERGQSYEQGKE